MTNHATLLGRLNGPIPAVQTDDWLVVDQAGVIALMREAAAAIERLAAKKVRTTRAKIAIK